MKIVYLCCKEEVTRETGDDLPRETKFYSADLQNIDLLKENHEVITIDVNSNYLEKIKELSPDLIFNAADAFSNIYEEVNLVKSLEDLEIHFTGCNSYTTLLASNKGEAKKLLDKNKISTANFQIFNNKEELLDKTLEFPLILKPTKSDASNGIDEDSVVYDEKSLRKKLDSLFIDYDQILVEKYIDGREFCIPVIGNNEIKVLPILEIDYSQHFENKPKILSFKAKWSKNSNAFKNTYSGVAKNLDMELEKNLKEIAKKVYSLFGCNGYASIDVRLDSQGNIYVLELNPNCYIAKDCDIFKSALEIGITNIELVNKICEVALSKKINLLVN